MNLTINADVLAYAQQYYGALGFQSTPTPWLVTKKSYLLTCPEDTIHWESPTGQYHVASAEQGFIELLLNGKLVAQQAQSTTPCFRMEPDFDSLHWPFFYKLELFSATASKSEALALLHYAKKLFEQLGVTTNKVKTSSTSWDLIDDRYGIEVGSYGYRHYENISWSYGTGLAQPRFDQIKRLSKI